MTNYCKKASELESLESIGIDSSVCSLLRDISIKDIVLAARKEELDNFLKVRVEPEYVMPFCSEIQDALLRAGYLRKDLHQYLESFNWLSFMKAAMDGWCDESLFNGDSNIKRILSGMTNEQYEVFEGLHVLQIKSLNTVLETCLSCDLSYKIVVIRFGLTSDGHNRSREDVSDIFNEDVSYIKNIEFDALAKFRIVVKPFRNFFYN